MEASRHMFETRLAKVPDQLDDYMPFPEAGSAQIHENIDKNLIEEAIDLGQKALAEDWEALPATLYLDYDRTGNRVNFENAYFSRRCRLNTLIVAEYLENKGRFIDEIANGLWHICEETGWQLPAHNSYIRGGKRLPLPDPARPVIDLFAAETGALLAFAISLLGKALDAAANGVVARIDHELRQRIVTPYLNEHFWWTGNGEERMNNWTAWCTQNILWTVFTRPNGHYVRHAVIKKATSSLDAFLKDYGEDGACEEGAFYYRHAGLCLFNAMETLSTVAPDAFSSLWQKSKIRNIADYVLNAHVSGHFYFNFADCAAVCAPCGAREFLFGQRIGSPALSRFAASDWNRSGDRLLTEEINLVYRLQAMFTARAMREHPLDAPEKGDIYYPSIGLFIARDNRFDLAVKAGDNGDSHNHNDVGSFIVYKDGKPLLIDVGVGSYTSKTFSPKRYEIWTMQSAYHNLPTFEGVMQQDGEHFSASAVDVRLDDGTPSIVMDIAGAYPPEAELTSYQRQVRLIKGDRIDIEDRHIGDKKAELSLMFVAPPRLHENQIVIDDLAEIAITGGGQARIEEIPIDDVRLRKSWPDRLFRVLVPLTSNELKLTIR